MAREIITRCDACGEVSDSVTTYTIRYGGESWEVDLDDKHAQPLVRLAQKGRKAPVASARTSGRRDPLKAMEGRIRNAPERP